MIEQDALPDRFGVGDILQPLRPDIGDGQQQPGIGTRQEQRRPPVDIRHPPGAEFPNFEHGTARAVFDG